MAEMTPYQIFPLTRTEAQEHTDAIKYHVNEAGRHLLIMRESDGWMALGYQSFTQYLELEFAQSRQHLYDLMRSYPVVERLQQAGYTPNTAQALALAQLPESVQIITYEMASKRKGGATADRIEAIGEVLTEALNTGGYVTTDDGMQAAIENAINTTRREQEIVKRDNHKLLDTSATISRTYDQDDGTYIVVRVGRGENTNVGSGQHVRIVIMEQIS